MQTLPLSGIRVADFGWMGVGPYATQMLALLGAEVIRLESSRVMDPFRQQRIKPQALGFGQVNFHKLSASVDFSRPEGVELVKKLVSISDVVASNFRPGTLERRGLGYNELLKVRPDLIMIMLSNVGGTVDNKLPGFAMFFAAFGGVSELTRYPGDVPSVLRSSMDLTAGANGAFATLCALYHRRKTGRGQYIDISASEAATRLVGDSIMDYVLNKRIRGGLGNQDWLMSPHNCYPCKGDDEWISIAVGSDEEWSIFCRASEGQNWVENPEFATSYLRKLNEQRLDNLIAGWTASQDKHVLAKRLQEAGVAAYPSTKGSELASDRNLWERKLFLSLDKPKPDGEPVVMRAPWRIDNTPEPSWRHEPSVGENNDYVFGELLGLGKAQREKLIQEGIISC